MKNTVSLIFVIRIDKEEIDMADIDVNSLEPNSHKYKAEKANGGNQDPKSREKVSPIVKRDQVVSTKKPLGKKFAETFMTEDTKDVKSWLLMDVIIPGVKNTILDILSMMFFGEVDNRRGRGKRRRYDDDRRDYSSYYSGSSSNRERRSSRRKENSYYDSDDRVDFRNIVLRNRDDAEDLIEEMRRRIKSEGSVSVATLLDLVDVPGRYTDNNWGWDDDRDIGIRRVSSGYLIDVAEPKYLD